MCLFWSLGGSVLRAKLVRRSLQASSLLACSAPHVVQNSCF
jgi:hypothetical protein